VRSKKVRAYKKSTRNIELIIARIKCDMTQADLANAASTKAYPLYQPDIAYFESGTRLPSKSAGARIAKALNVEVPTIFEGMVK